MSDLTVHIIELWPSIIAFNYSSRVGYDVLQKFIENAEQNHVIFELMILLFQQIIYYNFANDIYEKINDYKAFQEISTYLLLTTMWLFPLDSLKIHKKIIYGLDKKTFTGENYFKISEILI